MGFFNKIFGFGTKSADIQGEFADNQPADITSLQRYKCIAEEFVKPYVASANFLTLFSTVPEVFFPIDYIARRISKATFQLKKCSDDSVVWNNKFMNKILSQPNCLQKWAEFVYMHFVYKLATGNSYIEAAMAGAFSRASKWKMCDNYWVLPSELVNIKTPTNSVPLYGIANVEDIISHYELNTNGTIFKFEPNNVWHDRDGHLQFKKKSDFLKSESRLKSVMKPISNLIAVYEARNVIYVKRGGLGYIISQKQDQTGTLALTEDEKKSLMEQNLSKYGFGKDQFPYGISDVPIGFIRTNLSIDELKPFEESLADAIEIAGVFGIPSVLVPRKDQGTFSNQESAEKDVYNTVIITEAKQFCKDLTTFLGLEADGLYLDADFSDISCLQENQKEREEVMKLRSETSLMQFQNGIITLNDWRARIGESKIALPLFDKLMFEMSDEEIAQVNRVLTKQTKESQDGEVSGNRVQDEDE